MALGFSAVLMLLTGAVFVWLGALTFLLVRILKIFNRLTKDVSEKDLRTVLKEVLDEVKQAGQLNEELEKKLSNLKLESLGCLQKVGFIRYNPFSETGGNQSFVLAILDGNDNGFVVTSLHSREATRVFAKPVKEGKEAGFEFSKEEIQAILEAKKRARR